MPSVSSVVKKSLCISEVPIESTTYTGSTVTAVPDTATISMLWPITS